VIKEANEHVGGSYFPLHADDLYSEGYHGWTVEEIYADLMKKANSNMGPKGDKCGESPQPGSGSPGPRSTKESDKGVRPEDALEGNFKPLDEHIAAGSLKDGDEDGKEGKSV